MKIDTKAALQRAIAMDRSRYNLRRPILLGRLLGDENYKVVKFLKVLRHLEFYTNKHKSPLEYCLYIYYTLIYRRMRLKYGLWIEVNKVGPGLYIPHYRGGYMPIVSLWGIIARYHQDAFSAIRQACRMAPLSVIMSKLRLGPRL